MRLITRKSECKRIEANIPEHTPDEAIGTTLSSYCVKDGIIVRVNMRSYVSKEEMVIRNMSNYGDLSIKLVNTISIASREN